MLFARETSKLTCRSPSKRASTRWIFIAQRRRTSLTVVMVPMMRQDMTRPRAAANAVVAPTWTTRRPCQRCSRSRAWKTACVICATPMTSRSLPTLTCSTSRRALSTCREAQGERRDRSRNLPGPEGGPRLPGQHYDRTGFAAVRAACAWHRRPGR